MKTVGVIGLGDMGSGLAKNLIKAGFTCRGHDLLPKRMADFTAMGGVACSDAAEVGQGAEAVLIMVMNGDQVKSGDLRRRCRWRAGQHDGPRNHDPDHRHDQAPRSARDRRAAGGQRPAPDRHTGQRRPPRRAGRHPDPDGQRHRCRLAAMPTPRWRRSAAPSTASGPEIGDGQTVKACLQSLIGSIFTGAFEAAGLAAKAGVPGQVIYDVFSTSAAGCGITKAAIGNVMEPRVRKYRQPHRHHAQGPDDQSRSGDGPWRAAVHRFDRDAVVPGGPDEIPDR